MRRKLILLHQEDFEMKVVILRSELIFALKDLMFVIKHFEMFLGKNRLLPAQRYVKNNENFADHAVFETKISQF